LQVQVLCCHIEPKIQYSDEQKHLASQVSLGCWLCCHIEPKIQYSDEQKPLISQVSLGWQQQRVSIWHWLSY
jgi:hypothetical protein